MTIKEKHLPSETTGDLSLPPQAFELCEELFVEVATIHGGPKDETELHAKRVEEIFETIGTVLTEHAVTDPNNEPSLIQQRVLAAFHSLPNEESQLDSKKLLSINRAVAKYAPNLSRIRELKLRPFDEMALLKASALAGIVRGTEAGQTLAATAVTALRHEITNIMILASSTNRRDSMRFLEAYQRVVFASQALNELVAREGSEDFTSVDDNLLLWTELEQRPTEEDIVIPHLEDTEGIGLNDTLVQFRKLTELEQQERLKNLNIIGSKVGELFGDNCEVRYFDTIVFDGQPQTEDVTEGSRELNEDTETEESLSAEFFKDYTIAEITQHMEDGTDVVHVIAESIHYGNSCYVLRGDILDHMSDLVGQELTWRDVFRERKNTARQLGAQDFRHPKNTNLPERVLRYLSRDVGECLRRIALKWTESAKPIYDADMNQTRWNRLPKLARDHITSDPIATKLKLESWKDTIPKTAISAEIGRIVQSSIEVSSRQIEEVKQREKVDAESENLKLKLELETTKVKLAEAEETLASLRKLLGVKS
jgi:hypothetical protein